MVFDKNKKKLKKLKRYPAEQYSLDVVIVKIKRRKKLCFRSTQKSISI